MPPDVATAREFLRAQPFSVWLGADVRRFEAGDVEILVPCRVELTRHHGYVHGGAVSALADLAVTFAGGSVLGDALTNEFKISFVRPAVGETLVARGRVLHAGKTQATAEARVSVVRVGEEQLVAVALGTVVRTRA